MGDLNIDLLKYETHTKTSEFVDELFAFGLCPLITKPTRVTSHSATLIDHIHSDMINDVYKSGIVTTDLSDHFGIFTLLKMEKGTQSQNSYSARSFSSENISTFKRLLYDSDFSLVTSTNNINDAYDRFVESYQSAFNIAFPPKIYTYINKYVKKEQVSTTTEIPVLYFNSFR